MKGDHIRQDERIYGATLLDVTPTILTLYGLPVGEDMDGRVLVQAFEEPPEITRIPSWENEPGECGMHAADVRMDPAAAQAGDRAANETAQFSLVDGRVQGETRLPAPAAIVKPLLLTDLLRELPSESNKEPP